MWYILFPCHFCGLRHTTASQKFHLYSDAYSITLLSNITFTLSILIPHIAVDSVFVVKIFILCLFCLIGFSSIVVNLLHKCTALTKYPFTYHPLQKLLCSCLLYWNVNIKIHIKSCLVLYCVKLGPLPLREKQRCRISENMMARRMFETKIEVTGELK